VLWSQGILVKIRPEKKYDVYWGYDFIPSKLYNVFIDRDCAFLLDEKGKRYSLNPNPETSFFQIAINIQYHKTSPSLP
jgi:hypothetical protein